MTVVVTVTVAPAFTVVALVFVSTVTSEEASFCALFVTSSESSVTSTSAAVSTSSVVSTFKASVAASPASTFATGSANAVTPLPVTANVAAIIKAVTCFALIFFPHFPCVCVLHMHVFSQKIHYVFMHLRHNLSTYEFSNIIQYYVSKTFLILRASLSLLLISYCLL